VPEIFALKIAEQQSIVDSYNYK